MSNKVKVRSLVKRAWHSGGSIRKGETGQVTEADFQLLLKCGQVEEVDAAPKPAKPPKASKPD